MEKTNKNFVIPHTHTHSLTHIDTLAIDVSVETRIEFKETNSFLNIYTHTHARTHTLTYLSKFDQPEIRRRRKVFMR